ncbi:hypothetical protein M0P65_05420 [Candidatus Gracilibacteria bacterium]|nr:hypothetical protein [Candidatus Gracilibacteria bacterium]
MITYDSNNYIQKNCKFYKEDPLLDYLERNTNLIVRKMTLKKQDDYLVDQYYSKLFELTKHSFNIKEDILRMKRELDFFTTKLQSIELLSLYLIVEKLEKKLEKNLNNGKLLTTIFFKNKNLGQYNINLLKFDIQKLNENMHN